MKLKPKEKVIASALTLFSQYGFHATGIDTILAHSKVAKTTLYRHFRSKEELIIAVLRQRDGDFRNWLMRTIDKSNLDPKDKLFLVFDMHKQWAEEPDFNGCTFIKASSEYPSLNSLIHTVSIEHKKAMTRYLEKILEEAKQTNAALLALQLMLLIDGATVSAQMHRDPTVFDKAKTAAQQLFA